MIVFDLVCERLVYLRRGCCLVITSPNADVHMQSPMVVVVLKNRIDSYCAACKQHGWKGITSVCISFCGTMVAASWKRTTATGAPEWQISRMYEVHPSLWQ